MAADYEKVPERVLVTGEKFNKLLEPVKEQRERNEKRFEALEERVKKLEERD